MPTTLVIVESPAKCKKIESYLGPGYKVIASFGHLRTIMSLNDIDVNNNFNVKYSIIQENLKLKQIEKIRSEIMKSDDVIIATDDDREGEAIGFHICDLFGLSIEKTKRIIFHEITEDAIQTAILHPIKINMALVNAQQCRQIIDMLVGFTITPFLWNCVSKNHDKSLSAGRCQTPALRLIYDNYVDVKNSPGKLIYNTVGYFTNLNLAFELNKQFNDKVDVINFLNECPKNEFICSTTSPKKTIKKNPEPLTTSLLQQLASNELHISPKETMRYAQQLYEGGYITYMRTDSKKYCKEFIEKTTTFICHKYGKEYVSQTIDNLTVGFITISKEIKEKKEDKKETINNPKPQEAHEAIRPVNINTETIKDKDDETKKEIHSKALKLYELIWKRTVESCMPSAQYSTISAKISAPQLTEFVYKSEQVIFPGWLIVDNKYEKISATYQYISSLKQNIIINPKKIETKFTLIEIKSHYTEARLVQLLEEKGIGRPSTFASLVDKIQERKYVEKQSIKGKEHSGTDYLYVCTTNESPKIEEFVSTRVFGNETNKLIILPLGIIVIEFLLEKFPSFFDYDYTKEMENKLDLIAVNKLLLSLLCEECFNQLTNVTNNMNELKKYALKIDELHSIIIGKHGPVVRRVELSDSKSISFIPLKKGIILEEITNKSNICLEDVIETDVVSSNAIGKYKGVDIFIKKGKYGLYAEWGKNKQSIKEQFGTTLVENIQYLDVIKYLDKDVLDPTKPVGFVRELNPQISIRTGKFGDYIFYKKPRIKKAEFFKLHGFSNDYKTCDKSLLLNWIKQTYKIE